MSIVSEQVGNDFNPMDLERTTDFFLRGGYDFPYPDPEIEAYRGREDIQYDIAREKALNLIEHGRTTSDVQREPAAISTSIAVFREPLVLHFALSGESEKSNELIENSPEQTRVLLVRYLGKIGTNYAAKPEVGAIYFQAAAKVGKVLGSSLIQNYESHLPENLRLK